MSLSKLWEMVKNSKSWQAAVHGVAEPDVVELLEHQRLTTFPRPKRHLLLGRKVMINLDSILKSRDITLPTKVHLVKAMVFPVVMHGCESWTVKKVECQRIDPFEL